MANAQNTPNRIPQQEGVEFRLAPGFCGYAVGADGSVWTNHRFGPHPGKSGEWHPLKLVSGRGGRLYVNLIDPQGKRRRTGVHTLVLLAFVGPCPLGMECCHYPDNNPENNRVSNLRWDTHKANILDRDRCGTTAKGEKNGRAILTADLVKQIRAEYAAGATSYKRLSVKYGMGCSTVEHIITRRNWKHVG